MKNKKHQKSNILKYMPAFVFAAFILTIAVLFVALPKSDYSSSEKRYLQKFPDTSVENVLSGNFSSEFESYVADHFPNRNFWVGFNAYYELALGNNGSNGVYHCKDGYLINKPVSDDNRIEKNTSVITDFRDKTDVPITVMLAPSTGYVANDVLPEVRNAYNDDVYFDGISSSLKNSGVDFVDLRDTFKDGYAKGEQLYYKTDHHWTTLGAYTAYTQLCEALNITAVPKSKFKVEEHNDFYGTTYSTSGFWLTQPETIELWKNPDADGVKVKISDGDKTKESNSMYFEEHLSEDDKYPVFLDGNHALTEIENSSAKGGTVVVIKDSFSHSLAPFLAENYSRVVLVDMRYYKMNVSDLIKSESAEQVLFIYGIDNFATDTDLVWLK